MSDIEENLKLADMLLYTKYNKEMFEKYTLKIENLLILEYFLGKCNFILNTAFAKQKTGSNERT
jgi:hypothetical protein